MSIDNTIEATKFIEALYKHRHLLSKCYGEKAGSFFPEEEEERLQTLKSMGVIRPVDKHMYRLSKETRQLLDKGLNRIHLRDLSVDIGAQVETLTLSMFEYQEAVASKDKERMEQEEDELKSICFEITDFVADKAKSIYEQAKIALGNIEYGQQRFKKIQLLLNKLDQLMAAREKLELFFDNEVFIDYPFLDTLKVRFFLDITEYLDSARNLRQEIRSALHLRKKRELRTSQLQRLDAHLKNDPSALLVNARQKAHSMSFFLVAPSLNVSTNVDINSYDDELLEQYRQTIHALALKKPESKSKYIRESSGQVDYASFQKEREVKQVRLMFNSLLRNIITSKSQMSAIEFYSSFPQSENVRTAYWLHYCHRQPQIMKNAPSKARLLRQFTVRIKFESHSDYSGNRVVKDVLFDASKRLA